MDDSKREELTKKSNILRGELKIWEKAFSAANEGKKASREDIKNNPEIAGKYKEYNKIRDTLSGKIPLPPTAPARQTPRKRRHEEAGHGISKRQQISRTPSKGPLRPWEVDPYDSPSVVRNLFTPSRKALGPTPQKDGMVLGLFDLLQEDVSALTPSRKKIEKKEAKFSMNATPRKPATETSLTGSKTPGSSKRPLLDAFATPAKNRTILGQAGTPSSVSKLNFNTPSFLRRDSHRIPLPSVNEDEDGPVLSPQMVRVPRKPLVRGLSSMLAGLRKMEDEAADDDLEALREMEMEEVGGGARPAPAAKAITNPNPKTVIPAATKDNILVPDKPTNLVGAFDDEAQFDSEGEEPALGRDGQPLKVYKKKGQKRTTRRVKMKPSRSKPQPRPQESKTPADDDDEDGADDVAAPGIDAVPETQQDEPAPFEDARNFDSDSQSEYTASEGGTRYRRPDQSKKRKGVTKDGKIRKVARKVGVVAHQNFKRLKLRNSGAKGGPAHNSRFRRKK
ncbi:uncharacterized protein L3040_003779 [Drepanopeziza brunnea f. sp. 'multigermtubi']|uniref:DNA replication regulator SLD2 n=1 Tax=Marssonina brunnea f. sp. multigermtubi (strain MB_m1) TaxID=1072389 RepID=K1WRI0_MARBU|nr:DNA replication regulator SLD2 [Drepanopeziza brunnea f. sp. 'multigermtubi' MB_m1]EKD15022.1 DNA replication regulator SLD2 [Drepanopeziza brunnea f. sp. 'multigermtubi' MB_m1]KAJ5046537.1 hypothetical protein L3040_003779 [Drepanopeziza brunnea f. sp. 'multigermtubi']